MTIFRILTATAENESVAAQQANGSPAADEISWATEIHLRDAGGRIPKPAMQTTARSHFAAGPRRESHTKVKAVDLAIESPRQNKSHDEY